MARGILRPSSRLWVPESARNAEPPLEALVYCDESGNSGPNYLDAGQPFYVLGGWVVPHKALVDCAVIVEEVRKAVCPQREELKSVSFLRGDTQKREAMKLFKRLGDAGCIPLYVVAEKKYCVAAKIIETFLDPEYNSIVTNAFTSDIETKQELANSLYSRFPDAVLAAFADAYRTPTEAGLRSALEMVIDASPKHLNPEFASVLEGCRPKLSEIATDEADTSPLGVVSGTLNMPVLISFLMLVENLGRTRVTTVRKVVHDAQHAYGEGYKQIFKIHQGMHDWFIKMPGGGLDWSSIKHIADFEMSDSKASPLIQAADVLSGVLSHLYRVALGGVRTSEVDIELGYLLAGLLVNDPKIAWSICSDHCHERIGRSILRPLAGLDGEVPPSESVRTVSADKHALPVLAGDDGLPQKKFRLDLPMFAFVGKQSGTLLMINGLAEELSGGRVKDGPVVPLFTSQESLEQYLSVADPRGHSEEQEQAKFDVPDLAKLIDLLEAATRWSEVVVMDPGPGGSAASMHLPSMVNEMKGSLGRVRRIVKSGMGSVVVQNHDCNGVQVTSMLTSAGKYVAMRGKSGKIFEGATRTEAVAAAVSHLGLSAKNRPSTFKKFKKRPKPRK